MNPCLFCTSANAHAFDALTNMIQDIPTFIDYFDGIRRRTLNFIRAVPADRVSWSPKEDELTYGDIVRHLAAAEIMFVTAIVEGRWFYPGHEGAALLDQAVAHLEATHSQQMESLRSMDGLELYRPRRTLAGPQVKAWRLLMAMVEHEVHHRSQLATYLTLMGIEPPQIYGLGFEDIVALTTYPKAEG
jgi:uncharacterized damage-inducible protein DinB